MKFEHFALNVPDAPALSVWYETNLGLKPVKKMTESPFMTFLADDSGTIMLEIYTNPNGETIDFEGYDSLAVHLAFVSEEPSKDKERLIAVGATLVSEDMLDDGSHIVMLRDPWGISIQFCKRGIPMI